MGRRHHRARRRPGFAESAAAYPARAVRDGDHAAARHRDQTGLIGWASAPYDPEWAQEHPKRAAGCRWPVRRRISGSRFWRHPMRIGLAIGFFVPLDAFFRRISWRGHAGRRRRGHRDRPQHLLFAEYPARMLQSDSVSAARWLRRARPFHHDAGALACRNSA